MMCDRELRKKHHYCIGCGNKDAYTLNGRSYCADCAEKARRRMKATYVERYEKRKVADKVRRDYDIKNGLCTKCHKNKADKGYKTCTACRGKGRNNMVKFLRRNGVISRQDSMSLGLCAICCRNKIKPGKKLCAECYERQIKSLAKTRGVEK